MESQKIKYFVYARKSSEDNKERQMQSIESQEKELQPIIENQKLKVVDTIKEEKSAHTRGRLGFTKMMSRIENGEANGILVYHGNRLARNAFDAGWIITAMDEGKIKEIKTPHRTYYNTPDDKFFLQLEFGISKKDSDDKSVVVKRGLKGKCEKGWMPGVAPLGYLNTPGLAGGSRYLTKDAGRFDLIKKAWEMMASGQYSVAKIQEVMTNEWSFRTRQGKRQGGRPISLSGLYRIFNDPFYYGVFEFPRQSGIFYKGQHEPMITQETFQRVRYLLDKKVKTKPHTKVFAYTGIITCGSCGAQITASEKWKHQKNGNVHHYILYHCTKRKKPRCQEKSIQEHLLEVQIKERLDSISIPDDFHQFVMRLLKQENQKEADTRGVILETQQRAYTLCLKKLDGLIDMRAAGEIDDLAFARRKEAILEEKGRLESAMGTTGQRAKHWLELAEDVLSFAINAKKRFETGTYQQKREILSALGSNFVFKDRILSINLDNVLFPIQTIAQELQDENNRFEPLNNSINTREKAPLGPLSPSLLRGQDSNLGSTGYEPAEIAASPPRDMYAIYNCNYQLSSVSILQIIEFSNCMYGC